MAAIARLRASLPAGECRYPLAKQPGDRWTTRCTTCCWRGAGRTVRPAHHRRHAGEEDAQQRPGAARRRRVADHRGGPGAPGPADSGFAARRQRAGRQLLRASRASRRPLLEVEGAGATPIPRSRAKSSPVQTKVLRVSGRFREGLRLEGRPGQVPAEDIAHARLRGTVVDLWIRPPTIRHAAHQPGPADAGRRGDLAESLPSLRRPGRRSSDLSTLAAQGGRTGAGHRRIRMFWSVGIGGGQRDVQTPMRRQAARRRRAAFGLARTTAAGPSSQNRWLRWGRRP